MRIRDVFYVLISSMVFRAFTEILLNNVTRIDPYYISLMSQAGMYLLMLAIVVSMERKTISLRKLENKLGAGAVISYSLAWPAILLAFTMGENAIETIFLSRINSDFTYHFFNFHEQRNAAYPFLSSRVLLFVLVTAVLAPLVEELLFRVVLLTKVVARFGSVKGVLISSLIFMAAHFYQHEYISVFLFSIFVSIVYLRYRSLMLCVLTHASFNLLAFVHQYYFDIHWTRSVAHISSFSDWVPQIWMFGISSLILACFFISTGKKLRQNGNLS